MNPEGKPHGIGRVIWKYWQDKQWEDNDTFRGVYNQMYEGTWKNGMRTGYGRFIKWNGSWYEGNFLDNSFHG